MPNYRLPTRFAWLLLVFPENFQLGLDVLTFFLKKTSRDENSHRFESRKEARMPKIFLAWSPIEALPMLSLGDRVQQARGAFFQLGCHVIAEVDYQFVIYAYCQREESPSDIKSF